MKGRRAARAEVIRVFVSNHGGRAENSLRSAVECLLEVVAGVAILRRELQMVMRQAGTPSIDKITKASLVDRRG